MNKNCVNCLFLATIIDTKGLPRYCTKYQQYIVEDEQPCLNQNRTTILSDKCFTEEENKEVEKIIIKNQVEHKDNFFDYYE